MRTVAHYATNFNLDLSYRYFAKGEPYATCGVLLVMRQCVYSCKQKVGRT